mmetsp:Transcript_4720/g.7724  ORF Transcript_4720/g.7724 Transcript_4720/m.7724 type:complete len:86 (+) Transcript_4720:71-328(+)
MEAGYAQGYMVLELPVKMYSEELLHNFWVVLKALRFQSFSACIAGHSIWQSLGGGISGVGPVAPSVDSTVLARFSCFQPEIARTL